MSKLFMRNERMWKGKKKGFYKGKRREKRLSGREGGMLTSVRDSRYSGEGLLGQTSSYLTSRGISQRKDLEGERRASLEEWDMR